MSTVAYGRWGRQVENPGPDEIAGLLAELDEPDDVEHPNVWIDHESGWALSAFSSGLLVWEDAEEGPRHMRHVPRELMEELFHAVVTGDLDAVHKQAWSSGYG
ncbi:hypothetical protein ACQPZP_31165 [Spirillospora sp. CA-142024]|uniref:hypothetical protein n=1 Tax=Spirillospora sp. CA-142024 TaxID=3240036 RepID=UPI003D8D9836